MKRQQLTIFLDDIESRTIESIRRKFNPKQFKLIRSHITLCREDEIKDLSLIQSKLRKIEIYEFQLKVGRLKRFSEGKGVLIAIEDEKNQFHKLRELILQNKNSFPREHKAHITLMHPRNSTCDDKKLYSFPSSAWERDPEAPASPMI